MDQFANVLLAIDKEQAVPHVALECRHSAIYARHSNILPQELFPYNLRM